MPVGGRSKGDRAYRRVPVLMSALAGPERRRYGWRRIPAWAVVRIPPHAVPALVSEELRQGPGLCHPAARLPMVSSSECSFAQAKWITLPKPYRVNNSLGHYFPYDLRLAGVL
jgi:hypothetical protein